VGFPFEKIIFFSGYALNGIFNDGVCINVFGLYLRHISLKSLCLDLMTTHSFISLISKCRGFNLGISVHKDSAEVYCALLLFKQKK